MTTTNNTTLSASTSAIASALIQSSPNSARQEPTWGAATRPGETPEAARRRVVEVHDKAIQKSLADNATGAWPDWLQVDNLTCLGKVGSISAAMDQYYKPERLNRPGGMRETLIRSRQQEFAQGWTILASHHDAVNGRGLYIRKEAGALVLYASQL